MRWPWVGRGRLDDALEQVAYLRQKLDSMVEQMTRLKRREMGLPETIREPRPDVGEMPDGLRKYITGFQDQRTRDRLTRDCLTRRLKESWDDIERDVLKGGNGAQG